MPITRKQFLRSTPLAPFALQRLLRASTAGSRPNILFMFADDHAWQAVSAYGSRLNHTPNIDRIAQEGMLFRDALVTNSICAPSRAVILTGKYSHLNGVLSNAVAFNGSQQTFPKLLRGAGYQTALIGKWHLQSEPTGFDHWEVLPGQGAYYNPDMLYAGGKRQHTGHATEIITELSLEWLSKRRDPKRPFLLMCQHKAPHRNWMPAPAKLSLYNTQTIPEPHNLFDDYSHRASPARNQAMEIDRHMTLGTDLKVPVKDDPAEYKRWEAMRARLNPEQQRIWDAAYGPENEAFLRARPQGRDLVRWKYQRYLKDYLRTIASVDDSVGSLLRYLDATGLAENTIVVYSSDQGFYLGEHGWFDKRWMYEESLRTPLLIRWPGVVKPGSVNTDMVSNIDLPETFLEAAGVPVPADMQGRSLTPLLRGSTPRDWRTSFYYHYYEGGGHGVPPHYGVRTKSQKLIHYYETDEWEMFDLEKDPSEMRSVYGDPAYRQAQAALLAELKRLRAELKVPEAAPPPGRKKKGA